MSPGGPSVEEGLDLETSGIPCRPSFWRRLLVQVDRKLSRHACITEPPGLQVDTDGRRQGRGSLHSQEGELGDGRRTGRGILDCSDPGLR